jgi:hypothetical protein
VVPAAHELTRKTSIEPSKAQKGKQSNNSKNNYLIRLRALKFQHNASFFQFECVHKPLSFVRPSDH